MISFRMLKASDSRLWWSVGGLIVISLLMIFSVTHKIQLSYNADQFLFVKRQLLAVIVGLGGMGLLMYFDYRHLKAAAPFIYIATILLLTIVLFTGTSAQGAQRWMAFGPLSFQPSEISKLGIIIALAAFFDQRKKITSVWELLCLLGLIGLPFLLIFKQPDLGTALVFGAILLGMLAASRSSPRLLILLTTPVISLLLRPVLWLWLVYLLLLIVWLFLSRAKFWDWLLILGLNIAVGVALPVMWGMLKAYQQQRILVFLNPEADP